MSAQVFLLHQERVKDLLQLLAYCSDIIEKKTSRISANSFYLFSSSMGGHRRHNRLNNNSDDDGGDRGFGSFFERDSSMGRGRSDNSYTGGGPGVDVRSFRQVAEGGNFFYTLKQLFVKLACSVRHFMQDVDEGVRAQGEPLRGPHLGLGARPASHHVGSLPGQVRFDFFFNA